MLHKKYMRNRKPRRFDNRYRSNGRSHSMRTNGGEHRRLGSFSSNNRNRNNFNTESAEKLVEKYLTLAKEAQSAGDKTLSESYFQHADHFGRVVEEKILNQSKAKPTIQNNNLEKSTITNTKKLEDKVVDLKKE
jgi:hypothetical protein